MRTCILLGFGLLISDIRAQDRLDVQLGIDVGFHALSKSENLSMLLNIEPSIKASGNTRIGLRVAAAMNTQVFENSSNTQYRIDGGFDHGFISVLPTYNYYWNDWKLQPHVGVGLGPYLLGNFVDVTNTFASNPAERVIEVRQKYQLGMLAKGGIIKGKTRLGVEFNLIPTSDIRLPDGLKVGTVKSSYLGFSVGLFLGRNRE